jgi:cytosine/adenosine deaminase-related metal-dependent hydrolase
MGKAFPDREPVGVIFRICTMKKFSAQYAITNSGPVLKRPVITVSDDGTITGIDDTGGELREMDSVEFHNGIIIPGFVNCHCHLELSHMRGIIDRGIGLTGFLDSIRTSRATDKENIILAARSADRDMFVAGVNLCADICNTSDTFTVKQDSRISYINLLEVFGIDPERAGQRITEIKVLAETARKMGLQYSIVPHSVYSLSLPLFRLLKNETFSSRITSIHFMENREEKELVENHSGPLMDYYKNSGLVRSGVETVNSHSEAVLDEITDSGNLILVHNTFVSEEVIKIVSRRKNLFWCLCPGSNLYIGKSMPPVDLLRNNSCEITTGTDSLASNNRLDIFQELKIIQARFPEVTPEELVRWGTLNGAKALGMEDQYGTLMPGAKPGLLLIMDADLVNMKLLPGSYIKRLV